MQAKQNEHYKKNDSIGFLPAIVQRLKWKVTQFI